MSDTADFVLNQTMLRIKDPARSIPFYEDVLGMTLLEKFDFPDIAGCVLPRGAGTSHQRGIMVTGLGSRCL